LMLTRQKESDVMTVAPSAIGAGTEIGRAANSRRRFRLSKGRRQAGKGVEIPGPGAAAERRRSRFACVVFRRIRPCGQSFPEFRPDYQPVARHDHGRPVSARRRQAGGRSSSPPPVREPDPFFLVTLLVVMMAGLTVPRW
jgi:hypothetical protein